jgi:hypothetical protein
MVISLRRFYRASGEASVPMLVRDNLVTRSVSGTFESHPPDGGQLDLLRAATRESPQAEETIGRLPESNCGNFNFVPRWVSGSSPEPRNAICYTTMNGLLTGGAGPDANADLQDCECPSLSTEARVALKTPRRNDTQGELECDETPPRATADELLDAQLQLPVSWAGLGSKRPRLLKP